MVISYIVLALSWIIWIYCLLIVINAILSWVPFLANSFVGRLINKIVNPYLKLFRIGPLEKLAYSTGIDISPIVGLFLLYFVQDYAIPWLANVLFKLIG